MVLETGCTDRYRFVLSCLATKHYMNNWFSLSFCLVIVTLKYSDHLVPNTFIFLTNFDNCLIISFPFLFFLSYILLLLSSINYFIVLQLLTIVFLIFFLFFFSSHALFSSVPLCHCCCLRLPSSFSVSVTLPLLPPPSPRVLCFLPLHPLFLFSWTISIGT